MFQLLKTEGKARRGVFTCAHGTVQTPVFMNVGTQGAIKGALSAADLKAIGCQVELSNTYHLHLRPGDRLVHDLGGLHRFMTWDGPILTDSGGFQVFSLASLRRIKEEGVYFASHIDGHKIFMGPEESMQIQSNLGSDICMAFDECIENPAPYDYVARSVDRTYRWLVRCKAENARLNALPDTVNPQQMLWGINQGGTYADLRIRHMQQIAELDLPGYRQYWYSAEKKGYSGTAIFARYEPLAVTYGVGVEELDHEGRLITLEYPNCFIATCYTPNAQDGLKRLDHRMAWDDAFRAYLVSLDRQKPVIVCGDLNVAHQEIDLKNPGPNRGNAGFSDEERGKFTELLQAGFTDTFRYRNPDLTGAYSWWSYRFHAREKNAGWRIDYFLVSDRLRESVAAAPIYQEIYGSDHCPVGLELDLEVSA